MARSKQIANKSRKQSQSASSNSLFNWGSELTAIVLFALAVFILLSQFTIQPVVSAICSNSFTFLLGQYFFNPSCIVSSNLMGEVGFYFAHALHEILGFASLAISPLIITKAYFILKNESESPTINRVVQALSLMIFFCSVSILFSLASGDELKDGVNPALHRSGGGIIGHYLLITFSPLFGSGGTFLISAIITLISASFLLDLSLFTFFNGLSKSIFYSFTFFIKNVAWLTITLLAFIVSTTAYLIGATSALIRSIFLVSYQWLKNFYLYRQEQKLAYAIIAKSKIRPIENDPIRAKYAADSNAASNSIGQSAAVPFDRDKIVVVKHDLEPVRKSEPEDEDLEDEELEEDLVLEGAFANYVPPSIDLLEPKRPSDMVSLSKDELLERSKTIQEKLADFNVHGRVTHVHPGPVITMYEFEPAAGVKVGRIVGLQDDLAMALKAPSVRIVAPLPERGAVGIEIPNDKQEIIRLSELIGGEELEKRASKLTVPLGKDTFGKPVIADIATMPHLLMAGATGTGKSVCINALLISLLYRAHPGELQLILIDPKILELSVYEGIPHLKVPVVSDPRKAKAVLQWAVKEMDDRYRMLKNYGVRSIDAFNDMITGRSEVITAPQGAKPSLRQPHVKIISDEKPLPKIVIVIDELADLMLTSGRDVEELITRLAQKARAAGIHLILATQRPSVDVITGLIKANFPARISFRVSSRIDSRTILDSMGSERLLGKGDMLFLEPGAHRLRRVHGAFVSDNEVREVTRALRETCAPEYDEAILEACAKAIEDTSSALDGIEDDYTDPLYDKAVQFVIEKGQASTSMIQRVFRIGYNRAARIVDMMEKEGLVGPMDGSKARPLLVPAASNDEQF